MAVAVAILHITGTSQLVFQRRDSRAPTNANKLSFFGGSMEPGELPLQAIVREVGEETSLSLTDCDFRYLTAAIVLVEGQESYWHLFTAAIPDAPFEVYEGIGFECYTREEAMLRDDVPAGVVHLLRSVAL